VCVLHPQVDEYMASLGHTVKRMSLDPSQQQGQAGTAQQLSAEDLAGYSRVGLLTTTVLNVLLRMGQQLTSCRPSPH
jgi:hypothetical protein